MAMNGKPSAIPFAEEAGVLFVLAKNPKLYVDCAPDGGRNPSPNFSAIFIPRGISGGGSESPGHRERGLRGLDAQFPEDRLGAQGQVGRELLLLAAVAGVGQQLVFRAPRLFLRADEWTRGYLTTWLALAAAVLAGGAAAALVFV